MALATLEAMYEDLPLKEVTQPKIKEKIKTTKRNKF